MPLGAFVLIVEDTFLNQGIQVQLVTLDTARKIEELKLKKYEKLNQGGIVLNSYLNGISASLRLQSDIIKLAKKNSELCKDPLVEVQEFYEYNPIDNTICRRDLEREDLEKYINDSHLMVIKIQGIKEEEKANYEEWRKWNKKYGLPPIEMQRTIYFPIKYDEVDWETLPTYQKIWSTLLIK